MGIAVGGVAIYKYRCLRHCPLSVVRRGNINEEHHMS